MFSLNPQEIANGISSGDLYFPDLSGGNDFVFPVDGNPATTSPIARAGSIGGGADFFGELLKIGGSTVLGSARALGDGFAAQVGRAISGNTDAKERATFETAKSPQSTLSQISGKTLLIIGGVALAVIGLVIVLTRR